MHAVFTSSSVNLNIYSLFMDLITTFLRPCSVLWSFVWHCSFVAKLFVYFVWDDLHALFRLIGSCSKNSISTSTWCCCVLQSEGNDSYPMRLLLAMLSQFNNQIRYSYIKFMLQTQICIEWKLPIFCHTKRCFVFL